MSTHAASPRRSSDVQAKTPEVPEELPSGFAEAQSSFRPPAIESTDGDLVDPPARTGLDPFPRLTRAQVEHLLDQAAKAQARADLDRLVEVKPHRIGGADLYRPRVELLPRALRDRIAKRCVDLAIAGVALMVFAPVIAVIAGALWLEARQVFFVQPRVGRARTRFRCYKFRSMRPNADRHLHDVLARDPTARLEWARHQKLTKDPRTTRLGRFLRQSSLDELPQLINVLRGDMSLVGPRPIIAPEIEGYDADRAYFESRAFNDYAGCLPGITGLWQTSGRHQKAHRERVQLDQWYARNWSIWLDLRILARTVGVVLTRTGV